jgi:hypothetical protein
MRTMLLSVALSSTVAIFGGCGASDVKFTAGASSKSTDGSRYMLAEEPEDAIGVIDARQSASDGAPLTVVGRIGGTTSPWVNGRAAFMLLDASLMMVAEGADTGDGQICTGDCCAAERAHATMLVKILDGKGRVLEVDSRHLLGLAESDMVVVFGKATKDKSGNVALIADAVFIRK